MKSNSMHSIDKEWLSSFIMGEYQDWMQTGNFNVESFLKALVEDLRDQIKEELQ